ncbi:hypothetical protein FOL47_001638 [Perkinsus chesapeaki]|uniref:Uncharacterized protein n=1 Tax=Perkinsus chesapeaki TaxID=330153 RepID=A0A7J6N122_PERCH|nr:hypothetical protein FOL47_001638 [Perkinsus chesapeaki]
MGSATDDDLIEFDTMVSAYSLPLVYQQRFRRIEERLHRLTDALREQRRSTPSCSPSGSPQRMARNRSVVNLSPNDAPRTQPKSIYHRSCVPPPPLHSPKTNVSSYSGKYRSPTPSRKLPECHVDLSPYLRQAAATPEKKSLVDAPHEHRVSVESERILADLHAMDERIATIEREVKGSLKRQTPPSSLAETHNTQAAASQVERKVPVNYSGAPASLPPSRLPPGRIQLSSSVSTCGEMRRSPRLAESRPPSWRDLAATSAKHSTPSATSSHSPSEPVLLAPQLDNSQRRPGRIGKIGKSVQ